MEIKTFFDKNTSTLTYVVYDKITKDTILIDPVLDYDPDTSKYSTSSVDNVINFFNSSRILIYALLFCF
jgi:hypothetical protein